MSKGAGTHLTLRVPCTVVAESPLVERYIKIHITKAQGVWLLTSLEVEHRQSSLANDPLIFMIDLGAVYGSVANYMQSIRSRFPKAIIVVLGKAPSDDDLSRFLSLGIQGYVPYCAVENILPKALRAVWDKGFWAPSEIVARFARCAANLAKASVSRSPGLTAREMSVLSCLERRLCNKEIGSNLNISETAVKFHLRNLFSKLGAHDRHSLIEIAKRSSLIPQAETGPLAVDGPSTSATDR
jgi:two-component system, NarL family, response regulator